LDARDASSSGQATSPVDDGTLLAHVRAMSSFVRWLPFAAACAGIWILSSMPHPPVPEVLHFQHADKLLHFLAYAVLGGLALVGMGARERTRSALAAWALVAIWGVCDEWHQSFVPGRTACVGDLAADLCAVGIGLVAHRARRAARRRSGAATQQKA
jgi:VanZ family protein